MKISGTPEYRPTDGHYIHLVASLAAEVPNEPAPKAFAEDAAKREVERRLAALVRQEIDSQAQARQFLRTALRFIVAARAARRMANQTCVDAHLSAAHAAHGKAHRCLAFARLCRQRARGLTLTTDPLCRHPI